MKVQRRSKPVLLISAVLLAATVAGAGQRSVIEGIMARVNDRIITISDFRARLRQELSQVPSVVTEEDRQKFARELFDTMVEELVLLERADEKKLTVEKKSVDKAVEALRERNKLKDDAAFAQALAGAGLTEAALRERYRQSMLLQRVVQSEISPTEITSQEVHDLYDAEKEQFKTPPKVKLGQLFFPVGDDAGEREAVLRRVRGLVSRVREGADLSAEATLAGVQYQDLGEVPVGDLREEVGQAIASLADREITDPIVTAGGFQIIRLEGRIAAGYVPFTEVEEQLRRRLSQEAYQGQSKGLVDRLKKEFSVMVDQELVAQVLAEPVRG